MSQIFLLSMGVLGEPVNQLKNPKEGLAFLLGGLPFLPNKTFSGIECA